MAQAKREWDTRAWLVGMLGGIVGGCMTAWGTYPPLERRINATTHSPSASEWVSGVAGFLSLLILPGVVSGIARRRTFLWGLVPLALVIAALDLEDWVEKGAAHTASWFWPSLLIAVISLVLSSGPVSLFRWLRARARHRQEKAQAFVQAQREAASVPREGVWPPPPDYRA